MSVTLALQNDLLSHMPIEQVFQKHVVDGASFLYTELLKKTDWEYELRHELANAIDVSINDVVIVGSAKLGFSLKTSEFLPFDNEYSKTGNFRDRSDVDIAVVNRKFYDSCAEQIFHLSRHFQRAWIEENWRVNSFYKVPSDLYSKYAAYHTKGWIRPDYMPNAFFSSAPWRSVVDEWFRKNDRRKTTVGIYCEWTYLKHYQMDNLERLRIQLQQLEK